MKLALKWLVGLSILAFFSSYALADEDWGSCEGDQTTSSKSIEMPSTLTVGMSDIQ